MLHDIVYSYIKSRKIKLTDLSKDTGLTYYTLHAFLTGKSDIGASKLEVLLEELGVNLSDILCSLETFEKKNANYDFRFANSLYTVFQVTDSISQKTIIDQVIGFVDREDKRKVTNEMLILKHKHKSIKTLSWG